MNAPCPSSAVRGQESASLRLASADDHRTSRSWALVASPGTAVLGGVARFPRQLHRRARHIRIRTKHAAIAGFGFQQRAAALAVVEELASIGRHGFRLAMTALGAGDGGDMLQQFSPRRRWRMKK